jgi:hypothetical protein
MRLACLALLILQIALPAAGQSVAEPLFVELAGPAAASIQAPLPDGILDRRTVGMRLDRLFDAGGTVAARVELNAGDRTWIAVLERVDRDLTGFRSWVGSLEGVESSHVVFTERDGVVSGLINAVGTTYQIHTAEPGTYVLERLDSERLARDRERKLDSVDSTSPVAPALDSAERTAAADDGTTIDVLMLFSPAARIRAGGGAQIQSIASQAISDTNTIFARSGIAARVRLAGTAEFAITEAADMGVDLDVLEASATARTLRDNTRADMVQLLVVSPDLDTCGIANLLRSLNQPAFPAYSVADIVCLSSYTPAHEMGHTLGAQHAVEDGATNALFPYAYAYKDTTRGFRTVMAYACAVGNCPKIPNFSNPSVFYNGAPTGTVARNNALAINNAAATVANFRQSGIGATLAAPTGLNASVSGSGVTLQWSPLAGASSYSLLVGSASGTSNLFNAPVGNTTTVSGSVPPGVYFWRVFASNGSSFSAPSIEAQFSAGASCVAPAAPQNFQFTVAGRVVTLFWTPPSGGGPPATYLIEAGSGAGLANLYNAPSGLATSVTVQAPPGVFFVRIRSQNGCGISAPSNERVIAVQ